jgi:DNA polymerase III subunit epsilon
MTAFNMRLRERDERIARQLDVQPEYRVLRRIPFLDEIWCRSAPIEDRQAITKIAVIDTETTGLDPGRHKMIELAIVKMSICDRTGDLLDISPPASFLEDPKEPLSLEIEVLTGLSDRDLAGCSFDEGIVAEAFDDVDCILAHNAAFDFSFFRKRFPRLKHPWCCSMTDVDWLSHGLDGGRSVSALLTSAGHFPDAAHRAGPDAWSVAVLLAMTARDGRTIAAHALERARKPIQRLFAERAPFAVKDALKGAGYRWCSARKAWSLTADPERLANETIWLKSLSPMIQPHIEQRDWYDRYSG